MSKESDEAAVKTSSSSLVRSVDPELQKAVDAFIARAKTVLGLNLIGVVNRFTETGRIGFLLREKDRGEGVKAAFVDDLSACAQETGIRISLMPFPVNGNMLYECVVRRLASCH